MRDARDSARRDTAPMQIENLGHIDYFEAWERQRALADERARGVGADRLLLLEHPHVYTAGRRTSPQDLPTDGSPVVEVDRGGKITWHGPGQLVGYPIVRLAEPIDVVDYVRRLEEALIAVYRVRSRLWSSTETLGRVAARLGGERGALTGTQDRRHRRSGSARRHIAWLRHQLQLDHVGIRRHRAMRHRRCRGDQSLARTRPRCHRRRGDAVGGRGGDARTERPTGGVAAQHRTPTGGAGHSDAGRARRRSRGRSIELVTTEASPAPEGRKLLRIEVRNAQTPIERKPEWIKTRAKMGPEYTELKSLVRREGLHTVCEEAGCPNIYECWEDREATFLIGGEQCTRRCDFCQIDTGKPAALDRDEPRRVAESVQTMGLRYSTVTGVARDDLEDGGAWLYAETVRYIKKLNPTTGVELLIPDFNAVPAQLAEVFASRPEVLAHNVETVPRVFRRIRPAFRYERSLEVITAARDAGLVTKSNLILGMGETPEEVTAAIGDLHEAGCDILTITQYLRPSPRHHPVDRWAKPEEFVAHSETARELGFAGVMAGPLVRSSYRAGRLYAQAMAHHGRELSPAMAHLAQEGSAAQEATSVLARLAPR